MVELETWYINRSGNQSKQQSLLWCLLFWPSLASVLSCCSLILPWLSRFSVKLMDDACLSGQNYSSTYYFFTSNLFYFFIFLFLILFLQFCFLFRLYFRLAHFYSTTQSNNWLLILIFFYLFAIFLKAIFYNVNISLFVGFCLCMWLPCCFFWLTLETVSVNGNYFFSWYINCLNIFFRICNLKTGLLTCLTAKKKEKNKKEKRAFIFFFFELFVGSWINVCQDTN